MANKRFCPECGKEIPYTTKRAKIYAEKRNTNCLSCVMIEIFRSKEVRKKLSESRKGIIFTDEHCKNISESKKGIARPEGVRKSISESLKGKTRSPEIIRKIRLTTIKNIEDRCGQISPNYNSKAIPIIKEYEKKHGFNFQHAENGGEVCIDGYFPDGVDEKRKTIIEIDESHHFDKNGNLKQKDIQRQKYLEGLGYKFIRVKI